MKNSNWWYQATFDQRYEQVIEGRNLGMTVEQVAMNLKVAPIVVLWFARDNNIIFSKKRPKRDDTGKDMMEESTVTSAIILDDVLDVEASSWDMDFVMETFGDLFTGVVESVIDD